MQFILYNSLVVEDQTKYLGYLLTDKRLVASFLNHAKTVVGSHHHCPFDTFNCIIIDAIFSSSANKRTPFSSNPVRVVFTFNGFTRVLAQNRVIFTSPCMLTGLKSVDDSGIRKL